MYKQVLSQLLPFVRESESTQSLVCQVMLDHLSSIAFLDCSSLPPSISSSFVFGEGGGEGREKDGTEEREEREEVNYQEGK